MPMICCSEALSHTWGCIHKEVIPCSCINNISCEKDVFTVANHKFFWWPTPDKVGNVIWIIICFKKINMASSPALLLRCFKGLKALLGACPCWRGNIFGWFYAYFERIIDKLSPQSFWQKKVFWFSSGAEGTNLVSRSYHYYTWYCVFIHSRYSQMSLKWALSPTKLLQTITAAIYGI